MTLSNWNRLRERGKKMDELNDFYDNYISLAGELISTEYLRYYVALIHSKLGNSEYFPPSNGYRVAAKNEIDFAKVYFHSEKFRNFSMSSIDGDELLHTIEHNADIAYKILKIMLNKLNKKEIYSMIAILKKELYGREREYRYDKKQ